MNSEITKYLQELKKYLRRLDDSEIKDIEDFYTEYLEDAGVQTRAEIEEKVGTPRQLSLRILADYSLKDDGKESGGILPKTNIKTAWLIILALLATPATLIIGGSLTRSFSSSNWYSFCSSSNNYCLSWSSYLYNPN